MGKAMEFYKKHSIECGSCKLEYDDEKGKKKLIFGQKGWNEEYDEAKNGVFIKTGEITGICVIDLDNMENETCKRLKSMADKCNNLKVKTKRGYHYWFKQCELKKSMNMSKHEFDYRSNGGIILCPPSYYMYNNNEDIFRYEFIRVPKDGESINEISEELKNELIKLFTENNKKGIKKLYTTILSERKKIEKRSIKDRLTEEEMGILLKNLDIKRSDDWHSWLIVGLALKNDGYSMKLWDEFSKRSKKYDEGVVYYKWNYELKPHSVTSGTLIYWLEIDNKNEYDKLFKGRVLSKYKSDLDLSLENNFNNMKMIKLLESDITKLGELDYIDLMTNTDSYRYFNKFHMHSYDANIYYKIKRVVSKDVLVMLQDIENSYIHYKIGNKSFINLWKGSTCKNMVERVDFLPMLPCPSDVYNTFSGFLYDSTSKDYNMEIIKDLLDFIKYVINSEEMYEYFIKWVSHIRQRPYEKTNVAIILYSDMHGVGKNLLLRILENIFSGYMTKMEEDDINSRFNKILESKLLVWGDEIKGNNRHDADKLKNLITQKTIKIESKGKDSYLMHDYTNYIFTTNNQIPVKVELNDRRYVLINCAEKKKERDYYDKIVKMINNNELMIELDKFFSSYDLTNYKTEDFPTTPLKKENILYNLPAYISMVKDVPQNYAGGVYTSKELYMLSKEYAKKNKLSYAYTEMKCSKDLSKFFGIFRVRDNKKRTYMFPDNLLDVIDEEILKHI